MWGQLCTETAAEMSVVLFFTPYIFTHRYFDFNRNTYSTECVNVCRLRCGDVFVFSLHTGTNIFLKLKAQRGGLTVDRSRLGFGW